MVVFEVFRYRKAPWFPQPTSMMDPNGRGPIAQTISHNHHDSHVRLKEDGEMRGPTNPEELKAMRKLAKQEKKQLRKSKLEQELLRNLRAPKDTKVVLADKSLFEKWMKGTSTVPSSSVACSGFTDMDFPALAPRGVKTKPRTPKAAIKTEDSPVIESKKDHVEDGPRTIPPDGCGSTLTKDGTPRVEEPPTQIPRQRPQDPIRVKSKRKKKDPVVLDIDHLLLQNKLQGEAKKHVRSCKVRRINESDILYGNMLDSSQPTRSRGKHRELEKIRLSKLKLAIIRDRVMKSRAADGDPSDGKEFAIAYDKYISHVITKRKTRATKRKQQKKKPVEIGKVVVIKEEVVEEPRVEERKPAGKNKKKTIYRKYCDYKQHPPLDSSVDILLRELVRLQDRAFQNDPIKARAKRRHVVGLREVKKFLNLKKTKMLVFAPDLEAQETVYKTIEELKEDARAQNIPCVFALNRKQLGFVMKKTVPVSAVGILMYDGLEEKFADVKEKLREAQERMQPSESDEKSEEMAAVDRVET